MSTLDETPETDTPVRGAQTVAPVQASALQFAASILGEGGYTPSQQLSGTLSSPSRVHEEEAVVPAPVVAAPVVPAPVVPAPVVAAPVVAAPVHAATVQAPTSRPAPAPAEVVEPVPTKGWFARLLDKLLGRS